MLFIRHHLIVVARRQAIWDFFVDVTSALKCLVMSAITNMAYRILMIVTLKISYFLSLRLNEDTRGLLLVASTKVPLVSI